MASACAATSATAGRVAGSVSRQAAASCLMPAGQLDAASSGQLSRPLQRQEEEGARAARSEPRVHVRAQHAAPRRSILPAGQPGEARRGPRGWAQLGGWQVRWLRMLT